MSNPRITLEQWRALQAVVESGGYAQAAEALHKSQSTLTYAVQKIERLLGVKIFEIRGRKAVLTDAGDVLYRRAKSLLEDAATLERGAADMAKEWQPEIRIAVEILYPTWLLLECLSEFAKERPETRIEVFETVLTGTEEMLGQGEVDLAIGSQAGGTAGATLMPAPHRARPEAPWPHLRSRHGHAEPARGAGRGAALDGEQQGDLDPRGVDGARVRVAAGRLDRRRAARGNAEAAAAEERGGAPRRSLSRDRRS